VTDDVVIDHVRAVDPCPDGSAGWGASDEGRAARAAVLDAAGSGDRPPPRRGATAIVAVAAAVAVVGLVVAAVLVARPDGDDGPVIADDPSSTSMPTTTSAPAPTGPVPLDVGPLAGGIEGEGHALVAIGDRILVWQPDGQTSILDPATGSWTTAATAPTQAPTGGLLVWTGTELIAWGGHDGEPDQVALPGVAYDPEADTWRMIAEAPVEGRTPAVAGWDGHEILLWGGTRPGPTRSGIGAREQVPADGAAAYDPAADSWRTLDSPAPGTVGRLTTGVLDDPVAWVQIPTLPGTDPRGLALVAYSVADDAWRVAAPSPDTPTAAGIAGAADGVVVVVPYDADPTSGEVTWSEWTAGGGWRTVTPPSATGPTRCPAHVVALAEGPAVVRCETVTRRRADGTWTTAPDAPGGKVLPLAGGGFVVIDTETPQVWWYDG